MKGAPNGTATTEVYGYFKSAAVERLYVPSVTQGSVAAELEITGTQFGQRAYGKLLCFIEKGAGTSLSSKTLDQAKAAIFEYIEVFYNRHRRHSAIGYKTPQQAFKDMTWKMAA